MSREKSEFVGVRLTPREKAELESLAKANGVNTSAAARMGIQLMNARAVADGLLPELPADDKLARETFETDQRAAYDKRAHEALEAAGIVNPYLRKWLIQEIVDRHPSDPPAVARALQLGIDTAASDLVAKSVAEHLADDPTRAIFPFTRQTLWWLHKLLGTPVLNTDPAYIQAQIESLDQPQSWRYGRALLRKLMAEGVDLADVMERDETTGAWSLKNAPQIHKVSIGHHERVFAEGPAPTPQPRMTEAEGLATGLRSAGIGGKSRPRPGTRNSIDGKEIA